MKTEELLTKKLKSLSFIAQNQQMKLEVSCATSRNILSQKILSSFDANYVTFIRTLFLTRLHIPVLHFPSCFLSLLSLEEFAEVDLFPLVEVTLKKITH